MTVVVRIRGTDKMIEVENVVNFKMDTAHFWLKLKGDNYSTYWRRNVELVRIKDGEVEKKLKTSLDYNKSLLNALKNCGASRLNSGLIERAESFIKEAK